MTLNMRMPVGLNKIDEDVAEKADEDEKDIVFEKDDVAEYDIVKEKKYIFMY